MNGLVRWRWPKTPGRWDVDSIQTVAESDGDQYRLNGVKSYVLDGQYADVFIVSARSPAAVGLFAVDPGDPGVTVTPLRTLDATRPQARVEFSAATARALCTTGGAALIDRVQAIAGICLAAEQVGGAQRCLDMAVGYAKVRVQFGQPIGSFQAIKHKCADMLVAVESARSAVYYAADVLDSGGDPILASTVAQAHCSTAYTAVAGRTLRFTAESDLPGTIPRTCTSSAPRVRRCCSATPHVSSSGSPAWPGSEVTNNGTDRVGRARRRAVRRQ